MQLKMFDRYLVMLVFSLPVVAKDFPDDFLEIISKDSVEILCSDITFTSKVKLNYEECSRILTSKLEECNSLIKPLIPEFGQERSVFREKGKSLSTLYMMCVKNNIYER